MSPLYRTETSHRVRELQNALYKSNTVENCVALEQQLWDVFRAAAPEDLNSQQQAVQSIWLDYRRPKKRPRFSGIAIRTKLKTTKETA